MFHEKVLTISELAEYLHLHPSVIDRLLRRQAKAGSNWQSELRDIGGLVAFPKRKEKSQQEE